MVYQTQIDLQFFFKIGHKYAKMISLFSVADKCYALLAFVLLRCILDQS